MLILLLLGGLFLFCAVASAYAFGRIKKTAKVKRMNSVFMAKLLIVVNRSNLYGEDGFLHPKPVNFFSSFIAIKCNKSNKLASFIVFRASAPIRKLVSLSRSTYIVFRCRA